MRATAGLPERLGRARRALPGPRALRDVRQLANVTIAPTVGRDELTALVAAADVGLIPHVRGEQTMAMSPLKLFEYLAAGLPVASIDLPGIRPHSPARVALAPGHATTSRRRSRAHRDRPVRRGRADRFIHDKRGLALRAPVRSRLCELNFRPAKLVVSLRAAQVLNFSMYFWPHSGQRAVFGLPSRSTAENRRPSEAMATVRAQLTTATAAGAEARHPRACLGALACLLARSSRRPTRAPRSPARTPTRWSTRTTARARARAPGSSTTTARTSAASRRRRASTSARTSSLKIGRNAPTFPTMTVDIARLPHGLVRRRRRPAGQHRRRNVTINNDFTCNADGRHDRQGRLRQLAADVHDPGSALPASGVYLAKLTATNGEQTAVVFTVRDDTRAPRRCSTCCRLDTRPTTSSAASRCTTAVGGANTVSGTGRAVKVSFNRPLDQRRQRARLVPRPGLQPADVARAPGLRRHLHRRRARRTQTRPRAAQHNTLVDLRPLRVLVAASCSTPSRRRATPA